MTLNFLSDEPQGLWYLSTSQEVSEEDVSLCENELWKCNLFTPQGARPAFMKVSEVLLKARLLVVFLACSQPYSMKCNLRGPL